MVEGYICDICGKKALKVFRGKHYCVSHGAEAIRKFTDKPDDHPVNWKKPVIIGIIAAFAIGGFYFLLEDLNESDHNIIDSNVIEDSDISEGSNVAQGVENSNVAQGNTNSQIYQNATTNYNYFYGSEFSQEEIEKQQKEFDEQMENKDKILTETISKLVTAYFDLIEIYDEQDNYSQISHYANEILSYQPKNVIALDHLGVSLAREGLLPQSIGNYTKLLGIIPDDYSALVNTAWSYTQLEEYDEALKLLNELEKLSNDDLAMLANKCWVLHKMKDFEGSLSYCKRALDQDKNEERALGAYSLSLSLLSKHDESLPYYERLHNMKPNDLPTFINYANALFGSGDVDKALEILDEGLDKFPNQKYLVHNKRILCNENLQLQCSDS